MTDALTRAELLVTAGIRFIDASGVPTKGTPAEHLALMASDPGRFNIHSGDIKEARALLGPASADLAHVTAERDEAIEALRCIAEPINGTPVGDPWAFYADLQAFARAILAKHGKASEDTRGATVPARQGAGSPDGDYSQAPAPASDHGKEE